MSGRGNDPVSRGRRWLIDTVLMRADARPEMGAAALGAVLVLVFAAILFGAFPGEGAQGPVDFERAEAGRGADRLAPRAFLDASDAPSPAVLQPVLSAINTGRDFAAPEGLFRTSEAREWLDENLCAVTARRTGDERRALVWYLREHADLCRGAGRAMILAPMAVTLTPIGSAILSLALLAGLTGVVVGGARFLRRVRRAYRRLYVSEHRADHLEAEG